MRPSSSDFRSVLEAIGPVGADLLAVDWAATSIGPPEQWPISLQIPLTMLLSSRFSMWMAWGPELTFLCNEAYRRDTLGGKYPWALGKPASVVWAEIWNDIGPRVDQVMETGEATWDEALLLFLQRSGYREETYHTFSYSPLRGDDGVIAGLLCVVSEETERVIASRRMGTLRDLGSRLTSAQSEAQVFEAVRRVLADNPWSLPFSMLYLFEEGSDIARLAFTSGIRAGHPAAPLELIPGCPECCWPVESLVSGHSAVVEGLDESFGELPTGAWDDPPTSAYLLPLRGQTHERPLGFFVSAINPYRLFDQEYQGFFDLVGGHLSAGLAGARTYEAERRRAEQLAELDRAKTRFFTNVSHELRTPLTLLLGPAEDTLADTIEPLPDRHRNRVEMVVRNGHRLLQLVNNLLDFSRIEAGRMTGTYEPTDLAQTTRDIASMFRSAIERGGLEFRLEIEPLPEAIYVDREMWAKIVLNLLSNAVKFTFEGSITVGLAAAGDQVELWIADTGIGIGKEDQLQLFERFHRVAGVRSRSHEGSGIGLALVAELVALHGGTVTVQSEVGTGTRFVVALPRGSQHLPPDQITTAPPDGDSGAGSLTQEGIDALVSEVSRWFEDTSTGGHRALPPLPSVADPDELRPFVIVADDNADMREYLVRLLETHYEVRAARNGLEALELVREKRPDLVITDVMMPGLDGFGLLDALRSDSATADVRLIMVSARAGEEGVVEGLEAGADDYLVKPFSARELLARVHSNLELDRVRRRHDALERNRSLLDEAQRLARLASWEIDLDARNLTASDELFRMASLDQSDLVGVDLEALIAGLLHEDDRARVLEALRSAIEEGTDIDYEARLVDREGALRWVHVLGHVVRDADGRVVKLRGSLQDITGLREAEERLREAAGRREATAREHQIADQLQHSLLPPRGFDPEYLEVATFYRAGVEGTQVGGDWYDVIELGAGRTALVIGDVMGRGVSAAAIMGQLRSAIRAYARLDLQPSDVLELCDGLVRDMGPEQIVTCIYATYDPSDRRIVYARAGHLPPLLAVSGQWPILLEDGSGPPLGAGPLDLRDVRLELPIGGILALYTDGLVERRYRDLTAGITVLAEQLSDVDGPLDQLPERLVAALLDSEPDDDVAVLLARVPDDRPPLRCLRIQVPDENTAVRVTRDRVRQALEEWSLADQLVDDVTLVVSELVTNAIIHGYPPVNLRLSETSRQLVLEVSDSAVVLPRRQRPTAEQDHGRGLQITSILAADWGARPTSLGKCVWCVFPLTSTSQSG
jgi:PAS domain S-box-containing protein